MSILEWLFRPMRRETADDVARATDRKLTLIRKRAAHRACSVCGHAEFAHNQPCSACIVLGSGDDVLPCMVDFRMGE